MYARLLKLMNFNFNLFSTLPNETIHANSLKCYQLKIDACLKLIYFLLYLKHKR